MSPFGENHTNLVQPKVIACGNSVATFAMAVRFLTGPSFLLIVTHVNVKVDNLFFNRRIKLKYLFYMSLKNNRYVKTHTM